VCADSLVHYPEHYPDPAEKGRDIPSRPIYIVR
jgi:hypothetical protein